MRDTRRWIPRAILAAESSRPAFRLLAAETLFANVLIDQTMPERTSPKGLGGWLILVLLAIWIFGAAMLAAGASAFAAIFHFTPPPPFRAPTGLFTASVEISAGAFGALAGVLLARKNPLGPTVARTLLALTAGYSLLALLATLLRTGPVPVESLPSWVLPASYFIASVLALGYLLRSRRVAITYSSEDLGPDPSDMFHQDETSDLIRNRLFLWEELRSAEPSRSDAQNPADQPALQNPEATETSPTAIEPEKSQPAVPEPTPEPLHEDLQPQSPDTERINPQESSTPQMNPPLKITMNGNHSETDSRELIALKTQIAAGIRQWLAATANGDLSASPNAHASLLMNGSNGVNKDRQKLLDQVNTICDQAWSVHIGESPTLPNTPDSEGSLPAEIQKWAIAQSAFRLTRSLDIRAAMEVYGPFEKVAQDSEYLMAVGHKNSSEDAFGRKVDVAEYESHSGPEIAYKLILRAKRDMFEADMWARVASLAGDPDFLNRFAGGGAKAFEDSLEYWRGYACRLRDERSSITPVEAGWR